MAQSHAEVKAGHIYQVDISMKWWVSSQLDLQFFSPFLFWTHCCRIEVYVANSCSFATNSFGLVLLLCFISIRGKNARKLRHSLGQQQVSNEYQSPFSVGTRRARLEPSQLGFPPDLDHPKLDTSAFQWVRIKGTLSNGGRAGLWPRDGNEVGLFGQPSCIIFDETNLKFK